MSSEMRELLREMDDMLDGFGRKIPVVEHFANRLRALLTRTEAGADVADTHEYTLSGVLTYGAIAIQPEQGAVPSHLRNLLRQALDYLKIELQGRDAAPVADGEKGVNNPEWPLLDRVEFALRDAGFDYDEAFRIAHLAAHPHDASAIEELIAADREFDIAEERVRSCYYMRPEIGREVVKKARERRSKALAALPSPPKEREE